MARREIQQEGKDVATAIIRGLNELGRRRDQVEVTVIQEEKSGFLGFGGRPAIVRIIEKKWDSEHSTPMKPKSAVKTSAPKGRGGKKGAKDFKKGGRKARVERVRTPKENELQLLPSMEIQNAIVPEEMKAALACAKETLDKMVSSMGVKLENLNVWWDDKQHRILLTFDCDHPAIVIGKEGKTLESIQYIITLVVSRQFNTPISVMADTQNYWRKLEDKINREIDKALSMVKRTKRVYRFRPMSAQMRRYIHRFLADNMEVTTVSEGEGKWRKVVLKAEPRQAPVEKETVAPFVEQEASESDIAEHSAAKEECAASAENASCDCVVSAESTSCECVADTQTVCEEQKAGEAPAVEIAEIATPAEEIKVEEIPAQENTVESAVESATVQTTEEPCTAPAENAGCDCVVSSESTSCECVADTQAVCEEQKAEIAPAEINIENTTETPVENKAETNTENAAEEKAENATCDCVLTAESTSCECNNSQEAPINTPEENK